jgi:hypothetical protein
MRPLPALATLLLAASAAHAEAPRPIVVELFTSQGCSSCPPADRLLTELSRSRPDLLVLAFHVTYWNRLGWPDPYSLDAATDRQRRYARISAIGGIYTPQVVVDGTQDVVGSDAPRLHRAIAAAESRARGLPLAIRRDGAEAAVSLGAGPGAGRVLVIGYDGQHSTQVRRGENAGATLVESNIVRGLAEAGQWQGQATELRVAAPAGEHLAVIVQAADGTILGAARLAAPQG